MGGEGFAGGEVVDVAVGVGDVDVAVGVVVGFVGDGGGGGGFHYLFDFVGGPGFEDVGAVLGIVGVGEELVVVEVGFEVVEGCGPCLVFVAAVEDAGKGDLAKIAHRFDSAACCFRPGDVGHEEGDGGLDLGGGELDGDVGVDLASGGEVFGGLEGVEEGVDFGGVVGEFSAGGDGAFEVGALAGGGDAAVGEVGEGLGGFDRGAGVGGEGDLRFGGKVDVEGDVDEVGGEGGGGLSADFVGEPGHHFSDDAADIGGGGEGEGESAGAVGEG